MKTASTKTRSKHSAGNRLGLPKDRAFEFLFKTPDGHDVVIKIPFQATQARLHMDPEELEKILTSQISALRRIWDRESARLTKDRKELWRLEESSPRFKTIQAHLEARAAKKRFLDSYDALLAMKALQGTSTWNDVKNNSNETIWNPALRAEVIKLAGGIACLLGLDKFQRLLTQAVRQACNENDDGFFIALGAAFARARKLRKRPASLKIKSKSSKDALSPHIRLLIEWWLTEDGRGPQLCLFTDEAITDLLSFICDDEDLELEAVRKIRQRYKLIPATRPAIRRVRCEAGEKTGPRRIVLGLQ